MDEVTCKITQPDSFSFKECLKFLNRGYDECLYKVDQQSVLRLINLYSGLAFIQVSEIEKYLQIKIYKNNVSDIDVDECKNYVMDWFDLNRDLRPFYKLLESNQQTQHFAKKYHGLRLMGIVDLFEALCWCVIGQQINLTFAHKIKTRLVHKFGKSIELKGATYYCFPEPEDLLKIDPEELALMQFSKQKINYIINISQAFCANELNKLELLRLSKQQQMKKLTAIKGIGPWTANYVSMKCLRDMTCITYGDTGLSSSLHQHFGTEKKPNYEVIDQIFKPFAGWESYLNFYLWRSLADG
jgi:DNA-3-methyladenine glycosylase II